MYSVGVAQITIPSSFTRLKQAGYCALIDMESVRQLAVPADQTTVEQSQSAGNATVLPVVYISRIRDNIPNS